MTLRQSTAFQVCQEWFGKGGVGLDGAQPLKLKEDAWQNGTGPNWRSGDRKFYSARKWLFDEVERRMELATPAQGGASQEDQLWCIVRAMEEERLRMHISTGRSISVKEYQNQLKQQPALKAWREQHPAQRN